MKKILIALSLLIALPATVAAATPQEVYKALLQSYTSMSVMQQPNYAVAGQEGRLSLYVQDAMTPSQDNGSILMWYKHFRRVLFKELQVILSFNENEI